MARERGRGRRRERGRGGHFEPQDAVAPAGCSSGARFARCGVQARNDAIAEGHRARRSAQCLRVAPSDR